uniref:Uncharacterized protein n=1 Tax=Yersinia enterocolitica TaxID=630 RepID=B0RKQ7_YEREN|nr:hypothetical protein [Yersinia enterocolitica]
MAYGVLAYLILNIFLSLKAAPVRCSAMRWHGELIMACWMINTVLSCYGPGRD